MEYWLQPKITLTWPCVSDPIADHLRDGCHKLYFNPQVDLELIKPDHTLSELCEWVNSRTQEHGFDEFFDDPINHYQIAKLVKINLWVDHIQRAGIAKPMLLADVGRPWFEPCNGDNRMRVLERVPFIHTVSAFISANVRDADTYRYLQPVETLDQMATLCGATEGQEFQFRFTNNPDDYGIYWYEFDSRVTEPVTPHQDWCVQRLRNYCAEHATVFTPEWFDTLVDWEVYA